MTELDHKYADLARQADDLIAQVANLEIAHRSAIHNHLRCSYAASAVGKLPADATSQEIAFAVHAALATADLTHAENIRLEIERVSILRSAMIAEANKALNEIREAELLADPMVSPDK